MNEIEICALLKKEWVLGPGFFAEVGNGNFDYKEGNRVVEILQKVETQNTYSRDFVTQLWVLPSFMTDKSYLYERITGKDLALYYEISSAIAKEVERILGVPEPVLEGDE